MKVYKVTDDVFEKGYLIGYFTKKGFNKWLEDRNRDMQLNEKIEDYYFEEIIIINWRSKNESITKT